MKYLMQQALDRIKEQTRIIRAAAKAIETEVANVKAQEAFVAYNVDWSAAAGHINPKFKEVKKQ